MRPAAVPMLRSPSRVAGVGRPAAGGRGSQALLRCVLSGLFCSVHRFEFLQPWHQYNAYYEFKKQFFLQKEGGEGSQVRVLRWQGMKPACSCTSRSDMLAVQRCGLHWWTVSPVRSPLSSPHIRVQHMPDRSPCFPRHLACRWAAHLLHLSW